MASVTKESRNGRTIYRVEYRDKNKRRRKIRLGAIAKKDAMAIASKIQSIVSADVAGEALPTTTAAWLNNVGDDLHSKLASHGLCSPRDESTLGEFLQKYIRSRQGSIRAKTVENMGQCQTKLVEYFGHNKPLRQITEADAQSFRNWLVGQGYSPSTVSGHIKKAKQFFTAAAKAKAIAYSPFAEVVAGSQVNEDRSRYIPADVVIKAIDMAPDAQWRLLIALCRFAGLRCPSEVLALHWADVDLENSTMVIREGKTKKRIMPILPELRPYLEDAFDPESVRVISRYRQSNSNLRKGFLLILEKAGIEPWPRIFHNLRGSLETDLVNRLPLHVVCKWLGNSETIANRHYLKMTQEHFDLATTHGVGQGVGGCLAAATEIEGNQPQPIPLIPEEVKNLSNNQGIEHPGQDSNL